MSARHLIDLPDEAATTRLAQRLADGLVAGDTLLLSGPVGAGKSHMARAVIQHRLAALGRVEDVPSPTYTLIQSYDLGAVEIVHADLYRLADAGELAELGLLDAFDTAICIVEWPDRMGDATPGDALSICLSHRAEGHRAQFDAPNSWQSRLQALLADA